MDLRGLAVLLACVALLHVPVFENDFVHDDDAVILNSKIIHDVRNLPGFRTIPTCTI